MIKLLKKLFRSTLVDVLELDRMESTIAFYRGSLTELREEMFILQLKIHELEVKNDLS